MDCIVERAQDSLAIEIKSGKTIANDFFKGLCYWQNLTGSAHEHCFLIYGGDKNQQRKTAIVRRWNDIDSIFQP